MTIYILDNDPNCSQCIEKAVKESDIGVLCQYHYDKAYRDRLTTNARGDFFGDYSG